MKNVLTIIKKEFTRFFKDRRMVITVLLPGILIYVLYSVMGAVFSNANKVDKDYVPSAYVINAPQEIDFGGFNLLQEELTDSRAKEKVENGELDVLIIFPENFTLVREETVQDVKVYYNSSVLTSSTAYYASLALLNAYTSPLFTVNSSGAADLAGEKETAGGILSTLVPMLMFALLSSACIAVAPEAIAGEKERGTMATMLITPIKRWQLVLGKVLSLSCFALLSGFSSFIGVILSLPKLMGGFVGAETAAFYSVGDYFMLFSLIISIVLLIISVFSILSALAKSVKEAGTLITPLMIVIILLGVVSMFSSTPATGLFAIPILGSGLAMSAIMSFSITPLQFVLALISNLVFAAVSVVVLALIFKSERIMFNK